LTTTLLSLAKVFKIVENFPIKNHRCDTITTSEGFCFSDKALSDFLRKWRSDFLFLDLSIISHILLLFYEKDPHR